MITHKLIVREDVDGPEFFIVSGGVAEGYDLSKVSLNHVAHFKRSWQAVAAADHPVIVEEPVCMCTPLARCQLHVLP